MEVIYKESKKYKLDMQGYGTFLRAKKGLRYTNAYDIMGIAYVGMAILEKGTSAYEDMFGFISLCNLMQADKKFLFIVQDGVPAGFAGKLKKFTNLRFFQASKFAYMSDVVIDRNLFGSLLLDNFEPYDIKAVKEKPAKEYSCPELRYLPVVNEASASCLGHVDVLDTFQHTIEQDVAYHRFAEMNSSLRFLRAYFIAKHFQIDPTKLRDKVCSEFDAMKNDVSAWCMGQALLRYVDAYRVTQIGGWYNG